MARRLWAAGNFTPLGISVNIGYRFYAHHLYKFYNCDWQTRSLFPNPLSLLRTKNPGDAIPIATESKNRAVCG